VIKAVGTTFLDLNSSFKGGVIAKPALSAAGASAAAAGGSPRKVSLAARELDMPALSAGISEKGTRAGGNGGAPKPLRRPAPVDL
jgi:hypothetical protein